MGLQKITFDGANVTSKIDADLYHFLYSNQIGVLNNLKNSVSYSLSNNTITFQDGYVAVYGRIIYIEAGTSVTISPDSIKYGCVVVKVDTNINTLSIYIKEQAGTYPILTEDNLLLNNGIYELALCAYTKTTTSVTINSSFKRKVIEQYKTEINNTKTELNKSITDIDKKYEFKKMALDNLGSGVYRFYEDYDIIFNSLFAIIINNNLSLVIPGISIFEDVGSEKSFNYNYLGTNYSLFIEYTTSTITLTCGSTNHTINKIYLYK